MNDKMKLALLKRADELDVDSRTWWNPDRNSMVRHGLAVSNWSGSVPNYDDEGGEVIR